MVQKVEKADKWVPAFAGKRNEDEAGARIAVDSLSVCEDFCRFLAFILILFHLVTVCDLGRF
jgi:hypothetical protein